MTTQRLQSLCLNCFLRKVSRISHVALHVRVHLKTLRDWSLPILAYFDFKQPFLLHTDASDYAIGAVLCRIQQGMERVKAYWSRKLQKAERNYSTTEKDSSSCFESIMPLCIWISMQADN